MEWKDVLDMGLGVAAFAAFLKLVFRDMADLRQRLERLEDQARRQNYYLSRLVNAAEAQALRQGLRLRGVKEVESGEQNLTFGFGGLRRGGLRGLPAGEGGRGGVPAVPGRAGSAQPPAPQRG